MPVGIAVKVCGVTREEDGWMLDGIVDYIGFVVSRRGNLAGPRAVHPRKARDLASSLSSSKPVAVLFDVTPSEALSMVEELEVFPTIQYHRPLSPESVSELALDLMSVGANLAPVSIWTGRGLTPDPCAIQDASLEYLLVDADKGLKEVYEGGLRAPLEAYRRAAACHSRAAAAGGVNPENVCRALETGVSMVDVSSGVESSPGVKSRELVARLLEVIGGCR